MSFFVFQLFLFLYWNTATASSTLPDELFSPLIPQKIANTSNSLPSPIQYPQYTNTWNVSNPGTWLDFIPDTWTSGFFPASLYALNTRKTLCGATDANALGIADWLELGRSTSTGLIPLETNNTNLQHDVGFVSFPFAEELLIDSQNETAIQAINLFAADLAARFNPVVGCTRSWDTSDPTDFTVIIDNMMNLEVLWASYALTGNQTLINIANAHANTTMINHFREDGSTWHVVEYNSTTGDVIRKRTSQGYSDSRDFNAPLDPPPRPADSSAATVAANGLLLLAQVDPTNAANWTNAAIQILQNVTSLAWNPSWQSLLSNGTVNWPANNFLTGIVYGDYYYITAANKLVQMGLAEWQSIIILNSARSIYDLLERRSALYSDRPSTVMAGELYIASLVFEISHGHIVEGDDDYFIRMAKQVDDDISVLMVPGNFLFATLEVRYIPDWTGVPFKKKAKIFKQTLQNALNRPYQQVKEQIAAGNALPSFTASLIERKENPTEEDTAIFKWASFVFYTAGADTSVSVLSSFMLAMAVNPTKQRKAQAEIDRVIGSGRRPAFKDRLDLPYVESILKEVYRLNPVTPIAIPHNLNPTSDDEYRGWRIPKKSVVIANSWAVLHDAELYPFPFEFLPERYHQQEYQVNQSLSGPAYDGNKMNPDPRKFAFGYGRRVCPGQLLADDTVFISIVTILALFDIGPLTSGEEPKYTPHLIRLVPS
ncbi:hypothetical protein HHX47_DHR1001178 [Lentinula edodes]|nr:hypothetical protein HHX47_DHR1001178 [Lentinula edodes]